MRTVSAFRRSLIALLALAGVTLGSTAYADEGGITFSVVKAGIVIGGSAGSGTLTFHSRQYPPGIGGIQPFSLYPTSATSVVSIAAAIPSPAYNTIGVSVVTSAISIVIGPSSLAGTSVGAYPIMIATLANNHNANEPIVGLVQTYGATICPVPPAGGTNVALAMVDLTGIK